MHAFPASSAVALLALLLAVAPGRADAAAAEPGLRLAQLAPPVRLGPRNVPPPEPAPVAPQRAPDLPPPPIGDLPAVPPGVEVEALSEIDPDSIGVLDDAQGGLGLDMWRGTGRPTALRLLELLPRPAASPATRELTRRLLLTRATAPRRLPATTAAPAAAGPGLLALRAGGLIGIGDPEGALRLLRIGLTERGTEQTVQQLVEALFFANDNAGACKEVRERAQSFQSAYWLQASAFCLALAGDKPRAALVSELLAERGAEVSPVFQPAMDAITGLRAGEVKSLPNPTALDLAMMRAANLRLPADVVKSAGASALRAIALSPNAEFALRLEAAEQAFAAGALAVEQLMEIYGAVPFEANELGAPLTAAEGAWGPRGRALLLRSAANYQVPAARAEVLKRAWDLARQKGGEAVVFRAAVPSLAPMKPTGELMWFAQDAGRVLFAAGRIDQAMGWYQLAQQDAASNPEAAAVAAGLWPLVALAGRAGAAEEASAWFERWWAAQGKGLAPDVAAARAERLLTLLAASGTTLGDAAWARAVGATPGASAGAISPAALHMLGRAAAERRRGEAVALALVTLGPAGPAAPALAVDAAVRALAAAGLAAEAQRLALDSAVAGGL